MAETTPTPVEISDSAPPPEPSPSTDPSPSPEPSQLFASVGKPKLSGSAKVGGVLTAKPGQAKPAATNWGFHWYRNGEQIMEATGLTYTLAAADKGKKITVRVVANRDGYLPKVSASSDPTAKVTAGSLKTSTLTISGTKRAGMTLTADPGAWTKGTAFSFQWFRAGRAIAGAKTVDYKLTGEDEGLPLTVKVTGRLAGFTTKTTVSKATWIPLPGDCQGATDNRASKQKPFVVCGIPVISKNHRVAAGFRPALVSVNLRRSGITSVQLEAKTASSLQALFKEAKKSGHTLTVRSAYRSYATQSRIYSPGSKLAAPPGASEHQTGLAVDLAAVRGGKEVRGYAFGKSSAGKWVRNNAPRFGFVVRYPSGKQKYTGFPYEPWHLRYIGTDHARKVKVTGLTLEQYLQIR